MKRTLQDKAKDVFNMFKKQLQMVSDQTNKNISFPERPQQVAGLVQYIRDSKHSLDRPLEVGSRPAAPASVVIDSDSSPPSSCRSGASESWPPVKGQLWQADCLHLQPDKSVFGRNGEEDVCRVESEPGGAVPEEAGAALDGALQGRRHKAGPQL